MGCVARWEKSDEATDSGKYINTAYKYKYHASHIGNKLNRFKKVTYFMKVLCLYMYFRKPMRKGVKH